jgi:hypothetical protein
LLAASGTATLSAAAVAMLAGRDAYSPALRDVYCPDSA